MLGGKTGPEYSFPSFTVTVVRGSGFRPLLRPGSSCLGPGTGLHAQTWCWHPRILTAVGWSLPTERAVGAQSNRGHDFSLTTERPRGFSCSCSRALVLWVRGADSLQRARMSSHRGDSNSLPSVLLSLAGRGAGSCTSPARPLVAKSRRASAPCRWRLRSSGATESAPTGARCCHHHRLSSVAEPLCPPSLEVTSLQVCTCCGDRQVRPINLPSSTQCPSFLSPCLLLPHPLAKAVPEL